MRGEEKKAAFELKVTRCHISHKLSKASSKWKLEESCIFSGMPGFPLQVLS